jgi:prepilin-type N-terminal cleavage/methylation domain-containing protein
MTLTEIMVVVAIIGILIYGAINHIDLRPEYKKSVTKALNQ